MSHPTVAEAAVVGASDPTTGQGIVAFVILRSNVAKSASDATEGKEAIKAVRDHVCKEIGPIAKPRQIMVVDELPKTRQGRRGEPGDRRRHHTGRLQRDGADLDRAR